MFNFKLKFMQRGEAFKANLLVKNWTSIFCCVAETKFVSTKIQEKILNDTTLLHSEIVSFKQYHSFR